MRRMVSPARRRLSLEEGRSGIAILRGGNTVIVIPAEKFPLPAATFAEILATSDLPGGVVNIVTGRSSELLKVLAEHDDVDALWCYGDDQMCAAAKALSAGNLKQVWTNEGRATDLFKTEQGEGRFYLQHAYQVKNIWVPYGE